MYMVIHMVITFLDSKLLNIIKNNYFKLFVVLDLASAIFIAHGDGLFTEYYRGEVTYDKNEDLNKTIDKLKNTINNVIGNREDTEVISFSHDKNNNNPPIDVQLDIPQTNLDINNISSTPISSISMNHHPSQLHNNTVNIPSKTLDEKKYPPIDDPIQQQLESLVKEMNNTTGSLSTPISKKKNDNYSTSIVDLQSGNNKQPLNMNKQIINNISDTLSDAGSNLDLDLSEFENSL
jgi:hypothetical protein